MIALLFTWCVCFGGRTAFFVRRAVEDAGPYATTLASPFGGGAESGFAFGEPKRGGRGVYAFRTGGNPPVACGATPL